MVERVIVLQQCLRWSEVPVFPVRRLVGIPLSLSMVCWSTGPESGNYYIHYSGITEIEARGRLVGLWSRDLSSNEDWEIDFWSVSGMEEASGDWISSGPGAGRFSPDQAGVSYHAAVRAARRTVAEWDGSSVK